MATSVPAPPPEPASPTWGREAREQWEVHPDCRGPARGPGPSRPVPNAAPSSVRSNSPAIAWRLSDSSLPKHLVVQNFFKNKTESCFFELSAAARLRARRAGPRRLRLRRSGRRVLGARDGAGVENHFPQPPLPQPRSFSPQSRGLTLPTAEPPQDSLRNPYSFPAASLSPTAAVLLSQPDRDAFLRYSLPTPRAFYQHRCYPTNRGTLSPAAQFRPAAGLSPNRGGRVIRY